jgi:hypothetical protein
MIPYAVWEGLKGEAQDVPFQAMLCQLAHDLAEINKQGTSTFWLQVQNHFGAITATRCFKVSL